MLKKSLVLLVVSVLLILTANTAFAATYLNLSYDANGTLTASPYSYNSISTDVNDSFAIGLESVFPMHRSRNTEFGVGIEYQEPRAQTDFAGNFNFIPLYLVSNTYFSRRRSGPYFSCRLGYNFFYGDSTFEDSNSLSGGLYFGLGVGIRPVEQMKFELLYSEDHGYEAVNNSNSYYNSIDVVYSKISVVASYRF